MDVWSIVDHAAFLLGAGGWLFAALTTRRVAQDALNRLEAKHQTELDTERKRREREHGEVARKAAELAVMRRNEEVLHLIEESRRIANRGADGTQTGVVDDPSGPGC